MFAAVVKNSLTAAVALAAGLLTICVIHVCTRCAVGTTAFPGALRGQGGTEGTVCCKACDTATNSS